MANNKLKEILEWILVILLNQKLRGSEREMKDANLGYDFYTFLVDDNPRSYKEAITSPDAPFWKEAINSEIESIMHNHT